MFYYNNKPKNSTRIWLFWTTITGNFYFECQVARVNYVMVSSDAVGQRDLWGN